MIDQIEMVTSDAELVRLTLLFEFDLVQVQRSVSCTSSRLSTRPW